MTVHDESAMDDTTRPGDTGLSAGAGEHPHDGIDDHADDSPHDPAPDPAADPAPAPGPHDVPVVVAEGLGLRGSRGPVYDGVDLAVRAGELVVLTGAQGSGRTALLLTLAGRMAPSRGRLTVLGHRLPRGRRDVQHHTALVNLAHIDALDEALTVGEVVRERAGLSVPLWRRPLRLTDAAMAELAAVAYGPGGPPAWDTPIWRLSPVVELQTKLLLGLVGDPRMVVVDDLDAVRDPQELAAAWASLAAVAARDVAVIAATTNPEAVPAGVTTIALGGPADAATAVPEN